ncbi:MAG: IS91 family transposase [Cyclobacteriaceae bacterium]|nr:IS91 family transposase [Cyclobacteriaceae bacterium]
MGSKQTFQSLFACTNYVAKNEYTRQVMSRIHRCHTKDLGYHCYQCNNEECLNTHTQYHSCGNRHCPFCGSLKKDKWVEERLADLFPTPYYHIVFTVPHSWNTVMMQSPKELYSILFDAASATLLDFSGNNNYMGATPGITTVLHTWGQKLDYHVHLHCVVSGGGISNGQWVNAKRSNGKFLFPIAALRKKYKALFLRLARERMQDIAASDDQIDTAIRESGYKQWKVYAKAPFGGPDQVLKYLGRYTHKTAITSYRIDTLENGTVRFNYKDYADGNKTKSMALSEKEFLRRFEQHILPKRFVRIRHYGFLTNRGKVTRLNHIRKTMGLAQAKAPVEIPVAVRLLEKFGKDITRCTECETGRYELLFTKRFGKTTYRKPQKIPV